jgi:enoyl-CoA hydratase/carnithine racemase
VKRSAAAPVRFERRGAVAVLTLTRGALGNRFDPTSGRAFVEACERADEDDVSCVVVAHEGRDFCLGLERGAGDAALEARRGDFVTALAKVRAPVVVAITGRAADEGLELALAADLRIAAPTARFRLTQVAAGRIPSFGATQRLPRLVGAEAALRLVLLGEEVGAKRAKEIGLVTTVAPNPRAAALRLAAGIAERGPIALRFAKEAVRRSFDLPLDDGARLEHDLYALLQTTADRAEGVRSFLEKRKPRFRGR